VLAATHIKKISLIRILEEFIKPSYGAGTCMMDD
jgi:8-oxo-dGTP diphosphatase